MLYKMGVGIRVDVCFIFLKFFFCGNYELFFGVFENIECVY